MAQPLDYKNPATPHGPQKTVLQCLVKRENVEQGKAVALLAVAIPSLFVGPYLISWILHLIAFDSGLKVSDVGVFFIACALTIPALLWTERRWGGSYFDEAAHQSQSWGNSGGWTSLSVNQWQAMAGIYADPAVVGAFYLEIALWGPRQIRSALGVFRRAKTLRSVNRVRAGAIVTDLRHLEHGIMIDQLQHPVEDPGQFFAALAYLLSYDWIGASKDGRRVWILSDSRRALSSAFG